ncbi:MAG: type IV secretion system protein, partial [Alphaproteobacteria bacterium]|nr:type IV secretion system protein [Alphaproteobacteria bacterium]
MSKVWKLHKHFLTSLLLVFLFTFAFGAFMAVNDAMGQTMDNKEDTVANVYISESAFESSYEDAYETMHDAEIKVKELQGLYDEALSTKELLANTSGGDTKRMLSILEKHIKSYKEAEKEFKEAEEKFNELEKKATESKYNSRRRDFMKKRAIFEDPPIQKDAHVAYEHQKQTPKRKSEILTTNQEDNGICQLFTIFFNAASVVTKKSIDMFSKPMMQLLVIAFAIWIALQIVAFVSAPEVRDLKDLVSSIINKSFIIMILVGLLSTGAINFFNNFLSPIYTTGQKLAQTILTADNFEFEKDVLPSYCEGSSNVYDEKKGALPKEMGDSILCTMELIQQKASVVEELGKECLKKSWKERFIIIPHYGYLFVGLGLWIGAMLIILGVPFIMIDVVFQMAVAGALLPFGIAAFAFKPTSGYSKKIWETFLNSVFAFIFVSLISLMLCELFIETVVDNYGSTTVDNVLINIPWFGVEFLKVCFVCILAWAILPTAKDFAKEFSGAISSTKFGEGAATIAASATKSFAVKAGKETLEATVTNTGKAIKSGFGMAVGGIRNATRNS